MTNDVKISQFFKNTEFIIDLSNYKVSYLLLLGLNLKDTAALSMSDNLVLQLSFLFPHFYLFKSVVDRLETANIDFEVVHVLDIVWV